MASTNLSTLTTVLNKWLARLAPLFLLLAVLWLCWSIARIIWLFVAPPTAPTLPPVARQTNISAQAAPQSTFTFFSSPAPTQQPTQAPSKPANIAVKGVMTAEPLSNSSALIDVNGTIKNYRVGKQLEDTGYTLVDVEWNQITLADKQKNQTIITLNEPLELNQDFIAKKSNSRRRSPTATSNPIPNPNSAMQSNSVANSATADNTTTASTAPLNTVNGNNQAVADNKTRANNAINNAVNQLKQDPSGYLGRMGVIASNQGYEVTEAMPERLRNRIGLQSGDRVLSVNGQSVGSNPTADSDLLKKIQESGQAQIQVQRGEQVITIRQKF